MNPAAALEAPVPFYLAASVDIAAADTTPGSKRKVTGVAYSGEVVTHPWAGRVVFDLSTTNAPDKMPLLVEHDRAQRAGVGKLSINDDNITVDDGYLLPNVAGNAVAADADAGFPWQLSVHIQPGVVDTIGTGENATVNGKKVEGPLSIFRNSLIREVSFTPTGVDANTSAAVFSARAVTAPALTKDPAMSEQNLNEAVAAAIKPVQASLDAATANVTTVTAERDAALAELEKLRTENAKVATEARLSAVKSLFSDTGREFSDAAAAPYLAKIGRASCRERV